MDYREDSRKSDWSMGTSTTSRSFELESWNYVQHKDYQLNLLTKVGKQSKSRRPVPAVENERLSYYRGHCTSVYRIQIQYLQQLDYGRFLWIYVFNVLLRSMPLNYMHVFLGDYSPDDHLFASRMIPLCIGISWQVALATLLALVSSADILSLLCHYAFSGILYQSPWNNCDEKYYDIYPYQLQHRCYHIDLFFNITRKFQYFSKNLSRVEETCDYIFTGNLYQWCNRTAAGRRGKLFTAGPLSYFLRHWSYTSIIKSEHYKWMLHFAFIWISCGCFYKEIYRRRIWKVLNVTQLMCNVVYVLCTVYMFIESMEKESKDFETIGTHENILEFGAGADFDFLGESITAPPFVQILTSRSADRPVKPGRDSFMITVSNIFMYLFKGLINYQLKQHVDSLAHSGVLASWFNPFPIFYLWPFLFHDFPAGSFILKIFYMLLFITEYCIFVISYQLLIEMAACEWKWGRRWKASLVMSTAGFVMSSCFTHETKRYLYMYSTSLASFCETVVVCWLYPIGRLSDDIYFQYGRVTNSYRIWSLRILPIYTLYKLYKLYYTTITYYIFKKNTAFTFLLRGVNSDFSCVRWTWIVGVIPMFMGIFYSFYVYVIKHKQNWRTLLRPRPDYGPREHVTRQLRKQFDSRGYIGSQASRYLSRHLLAKSGTPTYRLDIRYDVQGRRSTVVAAGFSLADNRN